ncbi:MAG: YceI family protein [Opitutales bacterium]
MHSRPHPSFARRGFRRLALALLLLGAPLTAADYRLEEHTIRWTGSMPAKTHTGLLTPQSFAASIADDGTIESLEVVLDMKSIDVTDLEGKQRDKLARHLRSEDFFHVEEYPTASFSLRRHADGHLEGSITIRGVTQPIEIPVSVTPNGETGWTLAGAFSFDRQEFNVNHQNGGFFSAAKDKIIRDLVDLEIELVVAAS